QGVAVGVGVVGQDVDRDRRGVRGAAVGDGERGLVGDGNRNGGAGSAAVAVADGVAETVGPRRGAGAGGVVDGAVAVVHRGAVLRHADARDRQRVAVGVGVVAQDVDRDRRGVRAGAVVDRHRVVVLDQVDGDGGARSATVAVADGVAERVDAGAAAGAAAAG